MLDQTELDRRIAALCAEYEITIAAQARRAATLAAELAETQHKLAQATAPADPSAP